MQKGQQISLVARLILWGIHRGRLRWGDGARANTGDTVNFDCRRPYFEDAGGRGVNIWPNFENVLHGRPLVESGGA